MIIIAEIIGWVATIFRSAGMLCKSANMVKYLVSIGNLCCITSTKDREPAKEDAPRPRMARLTSSIPTKAG